MSWHDDCSSLSGWETYNWGSDNLPMVSDGESFHVLDADITEDDYEYDLCIEKNIPVSGDFEITTNITIPDLSFADADTYVYFDYYINLNEYVYNNDGSRSRSYFDFYFYKNGLDDHVFYLYGLQDSTDGISLELPFTGDLKVTKIGNTVTAYVGETILWQGTNENNNLITVYSLEYYLNIGGHETYPFRPPLMKINDINIIGNTISTNANLSYLEIEALGSNRYTNFDSETYEYSFVVSYNYSSTNFLIYNEEGLANITINSIPIYSGIRTSQFDLDIGENIFYIHVVAEDGITTEDYTLTLTRNAVLETDSTLSEIYNSSGNLSPSFDPLITEYSYTMPANRTSINYRITSTSLFAIITIDEIPIESGKYKYFYYSDFETYTKTYEIKVTAEDGLNTTTYTLTITRTPSSSAELSNLRVNTIESLSPSFYSDRTSYTGLVGFTEENVSFYLSTREGYPTITINNISVNASTWTLPFNLNVGENTFVIHVVSEDGSTTNDYTVVLTRNSEVSTACKLVNMYPYSTPFTPNFNPNVFNYTLDIAYTDEPSRYDNITIVKPTLSKMFINGYERSSPAYFFLENFNIVGEYIQTIKIVAEDNIHESTYVFKIRKLELSHDAKLRELSFSFNTTGSVAFSSPFEPDVFTYEITKLLDSTDLKLEISCLSNSSATTQFVKYYCFSDSTKNTDAEYHSLPIKLNVHYGKSRVEIKIVAEDGIETCTYTIDFELKIPKLHDIHTSNLSIPSVALCRDGRILCLYHEGGEIKQGYSADFETLQTTINSLTDISTALVDTDFDLRATTFNVGSDLFFAVNKIPKVEITHPYSTLIYKSASGNGGDWYEYGTVFISNGTQATQTIVKDTWEPSVPLVLNSGRWVISYLYAFERSTSGDYYMVQHAGIATSDDNGQTWTHRYNGGIYMMGGAYTWYGGKNLCEYNGNLYALICGNFSAYIIQGSANGSSWEAIYNLGNWGGSFTNNAIDGCSFYDKGDGWLRFLIRAYQYNKIDIWKTQSPETLVSSENPTGAWELEESFGSGSVGNIIQRSSYYAQLGLNYILITGRKVYWGYEDEAGVPIIVQCTATAFPFITGNNKLIAFRW